MGQCLQESAATADGILGNLQARNDISLKWKNPPWPSKYQKRETGRYLKKNIWNPEQERSCGFHLFPDSFHSFHNLLAFTTTKESFLVLFTTLPLLWRWRWELRAGRLQSGYVTTRRFFAYSSLQLSQPETRAEGQLQGHLGMVYRHPQVLPTFFKG